MHVYPHERVEKYFSTRGTHMTSLHDEDAVNYRRNRRLRRYFLWGPQDQSNLK